MSDTQQKFLLNPIPEEMKVSNNSKIYILFLSPDFFEISKGVSFGEGLWELTYEEYKNSYVILKEKIGFAHFLTVIKSGEIEFCSNTYLREDKLVSSPYLNVFSIIEEKEKIINVKIKIYGNENKRNHLLIEGIPEGVKIEGCNYIYEDCGKELNIGNEKELKIIYKEIDDFILTYSVIFKDGTSTSFPYKYNIKKKSGLKEVLKGIYNFTLKEDKNKFLTYVKIKNVPEGLCLSNGVRVNKDILLKPRDLKDISITSFDKKLKEVNLELDYNLLEDGKIKSITQIYKIILEKSDSIFLCSKCIKCKNRNSCEVFDILKYEYPYSPYLKYIE